MPKSDRPYPVDDGRADHLIDRTLPPIALPATRGPDVTLADLQRAVVFFYPMTGRPDRPLPEGWDDIPGARGCTPEACRFSDMVRAFVALETPVYGVSTQSPDYQREMADRLHLTYPVLSDHGLALTRALALPTFDAGGETFLTRLTVILERGRIARVFYPIPFPDRHPDDVLAWLTEENWRWPGNTRPR